MKARDALILDKAMRYDKVKAERDALLAACHAALATIVATIDPDDPVCDQLVDAIKMAEGEA